MISDGSDMWQMVVVIIALVISAGYVGWRVYQSFRSDAEPCCGCEGCPLKGPHCADKCHEKCSENHKNPDCCRKK